MEKNNHKKTMMRLAVILLLCLLLSGCSDSEAPKDEVVFSAGTVSPASSAKELTITLEPGETELLSGLPALEYADLSGSSCPGEISEWAAAHPEVEVKYTVNLPDGSVVDNDCQALDMSAFSGSEINAAADSLKYLPKLKTIELGTERSGLDLDTVGKVQEACPDAKIKYVFDLYGKETDFNNMRLNLSHIPVEDGGAAVMKAMDYMPNLTYVDMDTCGLSNEEMAAIRDAYPDIKVVWRVWFGDAYSVRTEAERILASKPSVGGMLASYNTEGLKYCTDVRFLDIGHNEGMDDISFIAYMPKLEVAVLAMNLVTDLSPLANCPNLEYLEIQTTPVSDLSPLKGLTKLHHLNICQTDVKDISPLFGMTELERLWLGGYVHISADQLEQMKAAAPNCEINTSAGDPTEGHWRYDSLEEGVYNFRYSMLRLQFGYEGKDFSFSWNDPLY